MAPSVAKGTSFARGAATAIMARSVKAWTIPATGVWVDLGNVGPANNNPITKNYRVDPASYPYDTCSGWTSSVANQMPGGNLGNVSAFGKAFIELADLGLLDRLPRLAVINAAGAHTFHQLFERLGLHALTSADGPGDSTPAI